MKQSLNDDDDGEPLVVSVKVTHTTFLRAHLIEISLVAFYFVLSTALPLYNKELSGYFDYPLTATLLQVVGAVTALFIYDSGRKYKHRHDLIPKSWTFNQLFLWKSLVTLPVSIMFALVISLTNVSIFITPIDVHVLLKSTSIVWIVIFAWIIEKEVPRLLVIVCVCGIIAGTIMISYEFSTNMQSAAGKILLNVASAFCEAVAVVVLKKTIKVLQKREPTIKAAEITLTKMGQALILLLLPTYLVEGFNGVHRLSSGDDLVFILVLLGVLITVLYQTTVVGLTFFSLATTLGILNQLQIIPQTALAIIWFHSFSWSLVHIFGAILVIVSSIGFGLLRYKENQNEYKKRKEFLLAMTKSPEYATSDEFMSVNSAARLTNQHVISQASYGGVGVVAD